MKPPRVGEAPISFECTVDKVIELGNEGGAGNLVISRVARIHINENYLNASGDLDTQKLDLVARMGESWYCRAHGAALFQIPKPIFNKGIGVDKLPAHVLNSTILTGNHLGRLGNMEATPSDASIKEQESTEKIKRILGISEPSEKRDALHQCALSYIKKNNLEKALSILFCLN